MRLVICTLIALGLASPAFAQDWDVLRGSEPVGSPTYWNWSGFYAGGQVAYAQGSMNFADATGSLVAYILRDTYVEDTYGVSNWTMLGSDSNHSFGFGGFVGYNTQWENAVLGVEASYTNVNWSVSSTDSMARRMDDTSSATPTTYSVGIAANSSVTLRDYTSIRARAGYAMGRFLPYGILGFVVGRADVTKSVTVTEEEVRDSDSVVTGSLGPTTQSDDHSNQFIYGYSTGLGLDVAVTPSIFLRGEYEYIQFFGLSGQSFALNTARIGAGYRF